MWLNSLGLPEELYVRDLFEDVRDGNLILRTMDVLRPGCVAWPRVNTVCKTVFKKVENLNLAVELAKSPFSFSLVGVQARARGKTTWEEHVGRAHGRRTWEAHVEACV